MSLTNTRSTFEQMAAEPASKYTRTAMVLHWTIALLIIVNVMLGLGSESLPDSMVRFAIDTHKSIGITVLGLVILRILWRTTHRPPPMPRSFPKLEQIAAHVALPLSGWMHDSAWKDAATHPMYYFGLFTWPRVGFIEHIDPQVRETLHTRLGMLHTWFGYALYALFAMHIGGALKHSWIDRRSVISRMVP
jgi:cytochrome b561